MPDRVWNFGPFWIARGDDSAPDSMTLYSTRALTAAPCVTVADPLPPAGATIMLQIDIPGVFTLNVAHKREPRDTPSSIAAVLAAAINDGAGNPDNVAALQAAGVIAGNTPGQPQIAVTNPANGRDVVTLIDASGLAAPVFSPSCVTGRLAWDAGPILGLGKMPRDPRTGKGIAPPPESCLAQIVIAGWLSNGVTDARYLTIGVNAIDADKGIAELAIYTENDQQKILSLSPYGLVVNGKRVA